jgi:Holliday junction resolvase-like predicted endonuclease
MATGLLAGMPACSFGRGEGRQGVPGRPSRRPARYHPGTRWGETVNAVAKGKRKEKLCADELKAKGYLTWKTIRHRFLNIDLFGLFDVVALAADGSHLLFIQVKSERVANDVRNKVRALKMPPLCRKEIWIWKQRRGWVKEFYE